MAWMQVPEALMKLPRLLFGGRLSFTWEGVPHVAEGLSARQRANLVLTGLDILLRTGRARGLPPALIVEATNICNLGCPLCPSGEGTMERPRGVMSFETFQGILDELGDVLVFVYLHCWGEPFLNKDMARMIEACTARNILSLCSTNGHYLQTLDDALRVVDAGLTTLIIAMDGSTQEVYEAYRKGGDLDKVKRCAALIEEAKARRGSRLPYTNLRVVLTRHTEGDLGEMERLAEKLGVDMFSYKDVDPQGTPERVDDYRPSFGSMFRGEAGGPGRSRPRLLSCIFPLRQPTVFWDGTVVGCEYDYDLKRPWGKVGEQGFAEIWNSPQAVELRRALRGGAGSHLCPRLCPYKHETPLGTEFACRELRPGPARRALGRPTPQGKEA